MPRYEIVAHVACEIDCATPEQAAAAVRGQLAGLTSDEADFFHLAVWREAHPAGRSPLPPALRRRLVDFFAALDRSAAEAESVFRDRVAAILATGATLDHEPMPAPGAAREATGG